MKCPFSDVAGNPAEVKGTAEVKKSVIEGYLGCHLVVANSRLTRPQGGTSVWFWGGGTMGRATKKLWRWASKLLDVRSISEADESHLVVSKVI